MSKTRSVHQKLRMIVIAIASDLLRVPMRAENQRKYMLKLHLMAVLYHSYDENCRSACVESSCQSVHQKVHVTVIVMVDHRCGA